MLILKKIIPSEFHQTPKILKSLSLMVLVNLLVIIASAMVAVLFFQVGFIEGGYIMIYSSIGAILYLVLLHTTKNLTLCGVHFTLQSLIVPLSLMSFTGGASSPFLLWLFAIGPVCFLYFKKNFAIFWSILTVVCFLTMVILQISGFPFEQHLSDKYFYGLWGFMFSFVGYIFVRLVNGFQSGLKKFNHKLKGSNTELERFAYIASHDLKSPLRNITSFIKLFKKKHYDQLDESGKEYLQIIATNAEQMHHLIEDILEYSQSNSQVMKNEKVDLNKVLGQLTDQIKGEENYQDAQINYATLPIFKSDFTRIKQVFQNLIDNGLKYNNSTPRKVMVEYYETKNSIHFLIKDNGIGMKEEYYERIFEMFKRLHNAREYEGTGIGLAICKKMVLQLGGKIVVKSEVGEGSVFQLIFPKSILWKEEMAKKKKDVMSASI